MTGDSRPTGVSGGPEGRERSGFPEGRGVAVEHDEGVEGRGGGSV